MNRITQKNLYDFVIRNTIHDYIVLGKMFTVYQIWKDACHVVNTNLPYDHTRNIVESVMQNASGWTKQQHSLISPDNSVGRVGDSPQVYHPVGTNVSNYDPNFRLLYKAYAEKNTPVAPVKKKKVVTGGLFRFNVWLNNKLVPCNLRQVRGEGGKFVQNQPYQGYGVLDDGVSVIVKQDAEGKLYAIRGNDGT